MSRASFLTVIKCFDIKKVVSSNDLVIIDWVLGGEPTKKKKKNSRWFRYMLLFPCFSKFSKTIIYFDRWVQTSYQHFTYNNRELFVHFILNKKICCCCHLLDTSGQKLCICNNSLYCVRASLEHQNKIAEIAKQECRKRAMPEEFREKILALSFWHLD